MVGYSLRDSVISVVFHKKARRLVHGAVTNVSLQYQGDDGLLLRVQTARHLRVTVRSLSSSGFKPLRWRLHQLGLG